MELGGVGRLVGWVVTGTLRAATAVKLSRLAEVIAISRTADATVAMLTVLGVDLLRDGSGARRSRVLAVVVLRKGCAARRDEDGDLLVARTMVDDGRMDGVDGGVVGDGARRGRRYWEWGIGGGGGGGRGRGRRRQPRNKSKKEAGDDLSVSG